MTVWEIDGNWHDVGATKCRCFESCQCGGKIHVSVGWDFYTSQCDRCWRPNGKPDRLYDMDSCNVVGWA